MCDRKIGPFDCCSVVCGDCLELMKQLPGGCVDAVITDPPYGEISMSWDVTVEGWTDAAVRVTNSLWCFGSLRFFLNNKHQFSHWKFAQDIVWEKQNGSGFVVDRFNRVHEIATHWYRGNWGGVHHETPRIPTDQPSKSVRTRGLTPHRGDIGNAGYIDDGMRLVRSVLAVPNEQGKADHPTQKPVLLLKHLVEYSIPEEGIVLDPFCGSGTTLVAAKKLGRHFLGFEISEQYCQIARDRLARIDAQPTLFEPKPEQLKLGAE